MSQPEPLKTTHCLAFLYLTFAHQTDGELSDDERSVIRTKLQEWCGDDTSMSAVSDLMVEAFDWYNGEDHENRIGLMAFIASQLKDEGFSETSRKAVLSDLISIAKSDGQYDDLEREWAQLLAKEMEIEFSD